VLYSLLKRNPRIVWINIHFRNNIIKQTSRGSNAQMVDTLCVDSESVKSNETYEYVVLACLIYKVFNQLCPPLFHTCNMAKTSPYREQVMILLSV